MALYTDPNADWGIKNFTITVVKSVKKESPVTNILILSA